ncbi:hypothetical protein JCM10212_004155 [Sporobolomyces blumeae]
MTPSLEVQYLARGVQHTTRRFDERRGRIKLARPDRLLGDWRPYLPQAITPNDYWKNFRLQVSFNEPEARSKFLALPASRRLTPFAPIVPTTATEPFAELFVYTSHLDSDEVRGACIGKEADPGGNRDDDLDYLYRGVVHALWATNNELARRPEQGAPTG